MSSAVSPSVALDGLSLSICRRGIALVGSVEGQNAFADLVAGRAVP